MSEYLYEFNNGKLLSIHQDSNSVQHGATVWDTCLVTAKYLERSFMSILPASLVSTKNQVDIVDVGTGTGLLGLVAASILIQNNRSPNLVLSDKEQVLPLARENLQTWKASQPETTEFHARTHDLVWGNKLDQTFDIVLCSDCVYDPPLFEPLVETLAGLCHKDSVVVIGYERRNFDAEVDFFAILGKRFRFRNVKEEEMDEQFKSPDDIYLFIAMLK